MRLQGRRKWGGKCRLALTVESLVRTMKPATLLLAFFFASRLVIFARPPLGLRLTCFFCCSDSVVPSCSAKKCASWMRRQRPRYAAKEMPSRASPTLVSSVSSSRSETLP